VMTVERIINFFPGYLQHQIRMELALTLRGVISQRLLRHASGQGRIPATEIMVVTSTLKKLLHEGRTVELREFIEDDLGPQGLARSVVVAATADRPPLERMRGALVATAVAEFFRDLLFLKGISVSHQSETGI